MNHKVLSLKSELKHLESGTFTLQETHYKKKGNIKLEDWEIFEAIRRKEFGGSIIGVHKSLKPILIQEYSEDFEKEKFTIFDVIAHKKVDQWRRGFPSSKLLRKK